MVSLVPASLLAAAQLVISASRSVKRSPWSAPVPVNSCWWEERAAGSSGRTIARTATIFSSVPIAQDGRRWAGSIQRAPICVPAERRVARRRLGWTTVGRTEPSGSGSLQGNFVWEPADQRRNAPSPGAGSTARLPWARKAAA